MKSKLRNNLKIAITGESGFVGGSISSYLYNENLQILPIYRKDLYSNDLKYLLKDVDVLIHSAGIAHDLKSINSTSEYFKVNTELTIKIFDIFLQSNLECFIFISSIKAVIDESDDEIDELVVPKPHTDYGKSKLAAENYILEKINTTNKRIYILRPTMIYGEGNKGNFNLLYKYIETGFPWPLGKYNNKRTFCSIDNLNFVIKEILNNINIPSGIYNIADDDSLSVNEVVKIIGYSSNKYVKILNIPIFLIKILALVGDYFPILFNSDKLNKLTQNFVVSNKKIKNEIKKELPIKSKNGIQGIYHKNTQF